MPAYSVELEQSITHNLCSDNEWQTCRRLWSSRMTATSLVAYEGASAQRSCRMVASSVSGMSPTCSSRNLERKALDSACMHASTCYLHNSTRITNIICMSESINSGRCYHNCSWTLVATSETSCKQTACQKTADCWLEMLKDVHIDTSHISIHSHQRALALDGGRWSNTHLTATVGASRVLSGKEHEVRMRLDHFSQLWHIQLSVVIQQPASNQSDAESIFKDTPC